MMNYLPRILESRVENRLDNYPVTAIIGPRQAGKSTLAKQVISKYQKSLYLDLERPSDLQKLDDAEWFLESQQDNLICIDEIQRKPGLFPLIRSLVDNKVLNGQFLILGSASRDLLKQSSESLAGRISYQNLTPFLWKEIKDTFTLEQYIEKGGFPRSMLAKNLKTSYDWRSDFIGTFLERDLLQWAGFAPQTMRRLWSMLAHVNGQTVNYSKLGGSLGVSHTSIRNYIELLQETFMVMVLPPCRLNTGKRLVKSPKVYLSDTGIIGALLSLRDFNQLAGHPVFGSLWETLVLSNLKGHFPELDYSFYRTSHGAEIDIIISDGNNTIAIECKATLSPSLNRGTFSAIDDVGPEKTFVVCPIDKGYTLQKNIQVVSLIELITEMQDLFNPFISGW